MVRNSNAIIAFEAAGWTGPVVPCFLAPGLTGTASADLPSPELEGAVLEGIAYIKVVHAIPVISAV